MQPQGGSSGAAQDTSTGGCHMAVTAAFHQASTVAIQGDMWKAGASPAAGAWQLLPQCLCTIAEAGMLGGKWSMCTVAPAPAPAALAVPAPAPAAPAAIAIARAAGSRKAA